MPPWSASATDGADLAALVRARQVRGYPESRSEIRGAWLSSMTSGNETTQSAAEPSPGCAPLGR